MDIIIIIIIIIIIMYRNIALISRTAYGCTGGKVEG